MYPPDEATAVFEEHRTQLKRLAYRMLGSLAEADDVVQDAWIRWQRTDHNVVRNPGVFLKRIVTHLCLDVMKSARAQREVYVGNWLPEPLVELEEEPQTDELTLGLMLVLERLSPLERAAFLLHDVFAVSLNDVAETLDRDPAAIRQLAVRARKHVQAAKPRYSVERDEGEKITLAFFKAATHGDTEKLLSFLWIDGLPGFASLERGNVLQTTALDIRDGKIRRIFITRNPDKLRNVARLLNLPDPQAH
ncbi:sigma factor [Thalassospira xianhensis]|uniref:RNA polymerase sigma factor SigJ n=1 Tax=Thalassospira xianhensis MCCC 1A02616 TaxID=1177929 RepID=A0A367UBH2_9PROT|nr:sigma factor [Thalassospira xianhensis]RCK05666.1 RNA polymerase sigma factor SigJ [Thalassospira xianhensis MCCC 1A02616]